MEQQFVITNTVSQTEIPALLGGWVKYKLSVKMLCPQKKKKTPYIHVKTLTCLCVGLLKDPSSFFLSLSSVKFCVGGLRQIAVS
jgi:hypothetical protein